MPNISVNAFVPGMVDTDFYEDIARAPRLERTAGNCALRDRRVRHADREVARERPALSETSRDATTGKIYALLTPGRTAARRRQDGVVGHDGKMKRGLTLHVPT